MLKGAIFDMDGLMFDTEQVWQKNWKLIADEMGITLDPAFSKSISGTSGRLMDEVIEKFYHVENGNPIAKDCIRRVHEDLAEFVPEKKGIHEILEFFKENGVKIAVASSSSEEMIKRNLNNTNTESYIDAVVSGQSVAHGKPEPDVFLKAAEMIGIDPKECYVFEDAFNGVKAGYAAGSRTIMIPDMNQPTDEIRAIAAGVYESLLDVVEALKKEEI